LHLVGYLYYWQMGFNSVFKGLTYIKITVCFLDQGTVTTMLVCTQMWLL